MTMMKTAFRRASALVGASLIAALAACATAAPAPVPGSAAAERSPTAATPATEPATLTVVLEGLAPSAGAVRLALYASQAGYEGGKAINGATVTVTGPRAEAQIEGLPPGEYGIKAFHDVNGDGTMNTNPFGIPTEPYAFSNNARGGFGPPGWDVARFTIAPGANTHTIRFQ